MEDQNPNAQFSPAASPADRKSKILYILLIILIISLSLGAFALYAWNSEKKNVSKLNSQIDSLQSRSTSDTEQADLASPPSQSSLNTATESKSIYKAEAGKFTLSLPSSLVVIEKRDGPGDGVLVTSLF